MKLHKLLAAVSVSAAAATAMTFASSANVKVIDGNAPEFTVDTSKWMVMLYKNDGAEKEIDYGLDLTSIAKMSVQFTTDDVDFFEGMFGGALVMSCGPVSLTPADHNWVQKNWWGVMDDDAEIWTQDTTSPVLSTKIGEYTYEVSVPVDESNCFYDNTTYCQAAIMEWGQDISQLVVLGMQFYDASGNLMIEFDANGKANIPNLAKEAPAETEAEAEAAPEETTAAAPAEETVPAPAEEAPAQTTEAAAPAQTDAAPVVTTAAQTEATAVTTTAATQAPAAGNVAAATANASKGSPDTGIADVAAIAGLAIVAGGAVLVMKKRK